MLINKKPNSRKAIVFTYAGLVAFACVSETGCNYASPSNKELQSENAEALSRTIRMARKGENTNTQYKVLFYGQSITSKNWTDLAASEISRTYPNVNFKFYNLAIGGNAASLLKRAVDRDINDVYPDLVVFHVYGSEQDYSDIVKSIRSRSAAEVILQTDHLTARPEPLCPVGLNITLRTLPGCTGTFWLHQHNWDDYMSGVVIPKLARRYNAAIDPRRAGWNEYVKQHHIEPSYLLQDGTHPNNEGWRLAAKLFTNFFNKTMHATVHTDQNLIKFSLSGQNIPKKVQFRGNRLELISSSPLPRSITTTIDGIESKNLPGCWITTRVSSIPWIPEWPAIRQVTMSNDRLEKNDWMIKIDDINDDFSKFHFKLYSKLHGFDGEGYGPTKFISNSGSVIIDAEDWVLSYAMKVRPVTKPNTLTLHWSRSNVCGYRPDALTKTSPSEYHYILATGLGNSEHTAVVTMDKSKYHLIKSLMSFKPWLS